MSFTPVAAAKFQDENMSSTGPAAAASKKRKRIVTETSPPKENAPKRSTAALGATNGNAEHARDSSSDNDFAAANETQEDISTTAAAALTAHLNEGCGISSFGSAATDERPIDASFDMEAASPTAAARSGYPYSPGQETPHTNGSQKPPVGSEEWHRVRRDNHKEVERRRRETINEGINELAKIVPGCEKNKGAVLAQAVTYIRDLKARQDLSSEQKSMEKSVLEQAVAELMNRNEELKERNRGLEEAVKGMRERLGDEDETES